MDSIQMKISIVILLTVAVLVLKSNQGGCNVYTVSSQSHQCSEGIINCHDLLFYIQNVSQYFVSNTEFKFLSGTHILSNTPVPVNISGINNITFTGQSTTDTPLIQCTDESHGFVFWNISNITLRSLIVEGCSPTIHDSPLTVTNCNSLTLQDFTIRNTTGVGLMIRNVNTIYVVHSDFSNNGLGIFNCSLVTYRQWWHSVSIIATDVGEVNYTISITDTVFNGNIASSGQLGGGLYCHIYYAQSAVVTLKNSMFRGINGCVSAAADIAVDGYMLANVIVNNSTFIGNYNTGVLSLKEAACGGGLQIQTAQQTVSYDSAAHTYSSTVVIRNSNFTYNRACYCAGAAVATSNNHHIHIINSTFKQNEIYGPPNDIWNGVGGICITLLNPSPPVSNNITVDVVDSNFVSNVGCDGTALQILPCIEYSDTNCNINIRNSIFQLNKVPSNCDIDMYSIAILWEYNLLTKGIMSIIIDNCHVINEEGGGIIVDSFSTQYGTIGKYFLNVYFKMTWCIFRANHMGLDISTRSVNHYDITIQSSIFSEHILHQSLDEGGVINIEGYNQFAIVNIVNVLISNNSKMSGIFVKNCILKFSGYNVIENNTTPGGGGGIQFANAGYVYMLHNTTVIFRNNKASHGGALYGKVLYLPTSHNGMCTFLSLRTAVFHNNSASIAGSNMYGGLAGYCYYSDKLDEQRPTMITPYLLSNCSYLSLPNGLFQFASSSVSSDPFRVLLCNNEHKVLTDKDNITVSLYPGQYIHVTVTTVGYCNGFSPGILKVSSLAEAIKITENDVQGQRIDHPCGNISFKPLLSQSNTTVTVKIDVAQSALPYTLPLKVIVNILSCPHGMVLVSSIKGCQCDSTIRDYVQQCNVSHIPNPFMKSINSNNWMTYNNERHCIDIVPICPFDYCSLRTNIYFNLDNTTDYQCSKNRTGTLCGQCQPGLSLMFGSNRCEHCSNNKYLLLLIVFFIAGILLIFLIMFLNLTVSVGMLNGLLFYANIVKLNETQLFPNGSIPVISQFISWLNLDFGIELCFYNGLDGYWKIWLQFVFPLYLWLVTIGIIQYSKYSIKFSRYLPHNIISVLATLILISFTKLLRTVTAVFMATRLHCGTHTELLWSVDGSIEYWSIKHSLLMGFAIIALIFIAVYTFLLLFSRCLQRASNYRICCCLQHIFLRIHPFIDAYTGPFVPSYGYWTGVLVLFRIIVTVVFTYTSGSVDYINNYVIVLVEVVIFNVFRFGFYQSKLNYYCEKFFHINLCVLCVINALDHFHDIPYVAIIATMTSVTLSLLVFIAIVCLHIYRILHKGCIEKRLNEVQPLLQQVEGNDENGRYSPSATVRRRDSIIFDFSIN